jgi:hypothetical protein
VSVLDDIAHRLTEEERDEWRDEAAALRRKIAAALRWHTASGHICTTCREDHPCNTLRALDAP